jgi:hypothetical protein
VVDGDPLARIEDAAKVAKVIKHGEVYSVADLIGPFADHAQHAVLGGGAGEAADASLARLGRILVARARLPGQGSRLVLRRGLRLRADLQPSSLASGTIMGISRRRFLARSVRPAAMGRSTPP